MDVGNHDNLSLDQLDSRDSLPTLLMGREVDNLNSSLMHDLIPVITSA